MPRGIPENKDAKYAKQGDITVGGIVVDQGQEIEPILASEGLSTIAAEEAFMNEILEVEIQSTGDENAPPNGVLTVNGRSQPWIRDTPIKMRRMFVEMLARCKETKYTPQEPDFRNPEPTNVPKGRTAFVLPFAVLHDPNPKGRAWLAAIKAEPA
ncbi:MAG: hypothetical protein JO171_18380 [Paludibacterium sp.]|uniref:hypothetical protein n=1 Tax=Paludibacterium sp. TaxID=1917523 RepID=UPI0025F39C46|nr:hypothetical protein [Paludibacterium sp.]MBV8049121.1 hypothetical protein [Paludibacterium sp.]